MRILLDTHSLLWWLNGDPLFSQRALQLLHDPTNDVLVSVVSLWEIAVKVRIGKLEAAVEEVLQAVRTSGFTRLNIAPAHLMTLTKLPIHHRDPFDHLLIAQAISEDAAFLSEDRNARLYSCTVIPCSA